MSKRSTIRVSIALAALGLLACSNYGERNQLPAQVDRIQATPSIAQLQLEWADNAKTREMGLMNRSQLPENYGMIFVFEDIKSHCFWMKDTFVPLSVGFINNNGILVQIDNMQPKSTLVHCSTEPIKYALEVNQGWFVRNNINIGAHLINISLP